MAQDIREMSAEKLRKRIKIAKVVLWICWIPVVIAVATALLYGKLSAIGAGSIGFLGLMVASIAMGMGMKKAKEELARRGDNQDSMP